MAAITYFSWLLLPLSSTKHIAWNANAFEQYERMAFHRYLPAHPQYLFFSVWIVFSSLLFKFYSSEKEAKYNNKKIQTSTDLIHSLLLFSGNSSSVFILASKAIITAQQLTNNVCLHGLFEQNFQQLSVSGVLRRKSCSKNVVDVFI